MDWFIGLGTLVLIVLILEVCEYLVWWTVARSVDNPPKYREFWLWLLRGGRHK